MTAFVVAVSPETASESVVDLAPRNFSRTAEPMETPATVLACERRCYGVSIVRRTRTGHVSVIQDDGATLVRAVFMANRGACVNEDAVDACLAAARCSVIDENELGGPATCGDAIAGRVYSV